MTRTLTYYTLIYVLQQKNLDELLLMLDKYNLHFSVIVLTETWLKSSYDWTDVPGYTAYHSIREGLVGVGVTTLVASYLIAESISSLTCNNNCHESIGVKIDANSSDPIIDKSAPLRIKHTENKYSSKSSSAEWNYQHGSLTFVGTKFLPDSALNSLTHMNPAL